MSKVILEIPLPSQKNSVKEKHLGEFLLKQICIVSPTEMAGTIKQEIIPMPFMQKKQFVRKFLVYNT